jgi:hypothetical protein
LPIEILELLIEAQNEPAAPLPEPTSPPSAADAARVVEALQRFRAVRADRRRAD